MGGFIYGAPTDNFGTEEQGTYAVPATSGEVAGATATQAFESGFTPRLYRQAEQTDAPSVAAIRDPRMPQTFDGESTAPANVPVPELPKLSPDQANQKYGIQGPTPEQSLVFKNPIPEDAAQDLYNHVRAQNLRLDTLQRAQPGILTSAPARLVYSLAGGALDPSNIGLAFIPGLGEANEARIAASVGGGFLGRTAARAASGVVAGAGQAAALEPLNYALDRAEGTPWDLGQAVRDVAWGGALGGGLHVIGGTVADALGRVRPTAPVPAAIDRLDPEAKQTLVQGAVAQAMEDRPIDVQPAFDLFQATQAEQELGRYAAIQRRMDADDAAQPAGAFEPPADRSADLAAAQSQLTDLVTQHDQYSQEIDAAQSRLLQQAYSESDPETAQRLSEIQGELSGTIPAKRRQQLVAEQTMLTEGRNPAPDIAAGGLETARSQAEVQGLTAAQQRVADAIAQVRQKIDQTRAASESDWAASLAAQSEGTRSQRIQEVRSASQARVTQALAERAIRRFVGRAGIRLAERDVSDLARSVLSGEMEPREALQTAARWSTSAPRIAGLPDRFSDDTPNGYLLNPMGRPELGSIPAGIPGIEPGPIRASRGTHNAETASGRGIVHIEARHGSEIRQAGYDSAGHFVQELARHYDRIYQTDNGALHLVRNVVENNTVKEALITSLSRRDDGYEVITGGRLRQRSAEKGELLWDGEHRSLLTTDAALLKRGSQSDADIAIQDGARNLAGQKDSAARDLHTSASSPDAQRRAESKAADQAGAQPQRTTATEGLADVQKQISDLEAQMAPKRAAEAEPGSPSEPAAESAPEMPDDPELAAAQALVDTAEKRGAGLDAIAACPAVIGA